MVCTKLITPSLGTQQSIVGITIGLENGMASLFQQ